MFYEIVAEVIYLYVVGRCYICRVKCDVVEIDYRYLFEEVVTGVDYRSIVQSDHCVEPDVVACRCEFHCCFDV